MRVVLVVLVVLVAWPSDARAEFFPTAAPSAQFTGQRPANDPWLQALSEAGRSFWESRGVDLPDPIALDVADDLREGLDGVRMAGRGWDQATYGEARIALDATYVGRMLAVARSKRRPTLQRRAALKRLASTLLHEQGHVGGVPHEEAGFMGAREGTGGLVPQEVARVVRRLVPRPHRGVG